MAFESSAFENTAFEVGVATITVALAASEAADSASGALVAAHIANLAATENNDSASFALTATTTASLAATEAADTALIVAGDLVVVTFAVTEATDVAVFDADAIQSVSLAANENGDTATLSLVILTTATISLDATEAADRASLAVEAVRERRAGGGPTSAKRVRYLVYRNDAVTLEEDKAPPKRLKKRKVSKELAAQVEALLPRMMGYTPATIQAALPETLYLPSSIAGAGDNIALALAAYLKRLDDEADEQDIELLLLAA